MTTHQPLYAADQLGQLLRAARKTKGLSQTELGQMLGLSQGRVSALELNPKALSLEQLMTWASVVGLELLVQEKPSSRARVVEAELHGKASARATLVGDLTVTPRVAGPSSGPPESSGSSGDPSSEVSW